MVENHTSYFFSVHMENGSIKNTTCINPNVLKYIAEQRDKDF